MTYRKNKNRTKKSKIKKHYKTRKINKSRKMRGGQDDKPKTGSLRLYRDENPQF